MKLWRALLGRNSQEITRYSWDQYQNDVMLAFQGQRYLLSGGSTGWAKTEDIEHSFTSYISGLYKSNGVIFAITLARMLLFTEARFCWFEINENGEDGRPKGRNGLQVLETPWPNCGTGELLARMEQDVTLGGNFFAVREENRLRRLRPDWVTIVLTAPPAESTYADVTGYWYHPGRTYSNAEPGPGDEIYLPSEVAHWSPLPDPEAQYRGMSWLTPVIREVMADKAARDHKLAFFENGATFGAIISAKENLTNNQYKEWKANFEGVHSGAGNAYKSIFLASPVDTSVLTANMQQLDFKVVQGAGETRLCAAGGVPPIIVGLSEGLASATYSNYGMARRKFGDHWAHPQWKSASQALSSLVDAPGEDLRLGVNTKGIAFLREDAKDLATIQQIKASTLSTLIMGGFTPESSVAAVEAEDLSLLEHTGLTSVQLVPPGTAEGSPEDEAAGEEYDALLGEEEDLGEKEEAERARYNIRNPEGSVGGGRFRKLSDAIVALLRDSDGGDPLEDFSQPQLKKAAEQLGLTEPRKRYTAKQLKLMLATHVRGDKAPARPVKKAAPKKKAPSRPERLSDDPAVRRIQVDNRIREAYSAVLDRQGKRPGDWVGLADLRDELGESTNRHEVDAALVAMGRGDYDGPGEPNLVPESNQKMLRPQDRESAVTIGDQRKHALRIGDPSPRPLPAATPEPKKPAAKKAPARRAARPRSMFDRLVPEVEVESVTKDVDPEVQSITDRLQSGEIDAGEAARLLTEHGRRRREAEDKAAGRDQPGQAFNPTEHMAPAKKAAPSPVVEEGDDGLDEGSDLGLENLAEENGLPATGTREELLARLREAGVEAPPEWAPDFKTPKPEPRVLTPDELAHRERILTDARDRGFVQESPTMTGRGRQRNEMLRDLARDGLLKKARGSDHYTLTDEGRASLVVEEGDEAGAEAEADNRVRQAVRDALGPDSTSPLRDSGYASLADVRDRLGDMPREEQDAALRRLIREPDVTIAPIVSGQDEMTPRQAAAAVRIGGEDKHYIAIDPGEPATPDPLSSLRTLDPEAARDALDLRKVDELKALIRQVNARDGVKLPVSGRKRELVDRLVGHVHPGGTEASTVLTGERALRAAPASRLAGFERPQGALSLTDAERDALDEYGSDGQGINERVRQGTTTARDRRVLARIDGLMARSGLTSDVELWRGSRTGRGVFGDRLTGDLTDFEWTEDTYVSTSTEQRIADQFGDLPTDGGEKTPLVMRMRVPRDTGAVAMSGQPTGDMFAAGPQGELLLQRGLRLRVARDHGVVDGVRRLDIEVRPAASPAAPAGRPSGLPADRKLVSADFDDLADRVQGKTEDQILAILQDLNATELARLARKFSGGRGGGGLGGSQYKPRGIAIPTELSIDERRRWLAGKIADQRWSWRSEEPDPDDILRSEDEPEDDDPGEPDDEQRARAQTRVDEIDDDSDEPEDEYDAYRAAGMDTPTPAGEQLHHYWTRGAGLRRWAGSPHPWTALYRHLTKHVGAARAKRMASAWFHEVFGIWSGHRKGDNPVGPG